MPEVLYHFCCSHSKRQIGTSNCLLIPQGVHPLLGCKVLWLTTEAEPDRQATGLGNNTGLAGCDRMQFRYVVTDVSQCRPWLDSPERAYARPKVIEDLESYGDPEHWWIAGRPVRATFDRTWTGTTQPLVDTRQ